MKSFELQLKPLEPAHYEEWLQLYRGYAEHYRVSLTEKGVAATWGLAHG